ncbi:MAG TPA: glycoside hydrolase family 16 protein [Verrucomicrobiae bacterium]|nr:glycoside hydrolase family 16 protein [Verrucomicrobiae bacterium]
MMFANSTQAQISNVLSDPGFENGLTGWSAFGGNTYSQTDATQAHSGNNYFKIYQAFNGQVNYNGIYQDYPATVGATFTADGWAKTTSGDKLAGANLAWIDVTFRDSSSNTLALYRSFIISTNSLQAGTFPVDTWTYLAATNQYNPSTFQIIGGVSNLVAPTGTAFIRYELFLQGDASTAGNGSVYFDDAELNQVQPGGSTPTPLATQMNIVWNDEFNGTAVNSHHWTFEMGNGDGGWGNGELEYYTNRPQNVYVTNGILHIVAIKGAFQGFNYTSARMKTEGLYSKKYGRFEFRAKLPTGTGYWPALWLFPEDSVYGGWAASGEIDVMENRGSIPSTVLGTLHYGGPYPNQQQSQNNGYVFANNSVTNWHTYDLDWTNNAIKWSVDGVAYETQTSWYSASNPANQSVHNAYPAPFDQPFYIIMNLAIAGGSFESPPTAATVFPQDMQVDYVRVYDLTPPLQFTMTHTNSNLALNWPSQIVCHLQSQTNQSGSPSGAWIDLAITNGPYVLPKPPTNAAVFYRLVSP